MAEEIDFEKCNDRNFRGPVTLTLNRVIRHTVMHHSSTSMYKPNFTEIGQIFCGRTYVRTDVPTDGRAFPRLMKLGRLGGDDLMNDCKRAVFISTRSSYYKTENWNAFEHISLRIFRLMKNLCNHNVFTLFSFTFLLAVYGSHFELQVQTNEDTAQVDRDGTGTMLTSDPTRPNWRYMTQWPDDLT